MLLFEDWEEKIKYNTLKHYSYGIEINIDTDEYFGKNIKNKNKTHQN